MPGVEVDVVADLPSAAALGALHNHLDTLIIDAAAPADLMGLLRQLNAERPDLNCIVLADSLAQEKAALAAGAGSALLKGFLDERLGRVVLKPAALPQVQPTPTHGFSIHEEEAMKGKYVVLLVVALLLVVLAAGCRGAVTPTPRPTARPLVTQVALITATPAASSVAPTASAPTQAPAQPTAAKPGPQPSPQPTEKRPPIIQLVAPMAGRVSQGQRVVVQALAGDDSGVGRVELWVDSELIGMSQGGPGLTTLQATQEWVAGKPGDHVLTVLAFDIFGNRSQPASVTIAVAADLRRRRCSSSSRCSASSSRSASRPSSRRWLTTRSASPRLSCGPTISSSPTT